jgi:hypothetical protein
MPWYEFALADRRTSQSYFISRSTAVVTARDRLMVSRVEQTLRKSSLCAAPLKAKCYPAAAIY